MRIPRSIINNYTRGINGLSENAKRGIADTMAMFEFSDDVAADRDRIIGIMEAALRPYISNVMQLSRAFYNIVRLWSVGEELDAQLEIDDVFDKDSMENAVRAFMQKAVDGKADQIPGLLLERVDYELKRAAAETTRQLGFRDPKEGYYARVPSGAETCEFCMALAGLGYWYKSERSASAHIHKGCDCRVVPSFGGKSIEGYDPDDCLNKFYESVENRAKGIQEQLQAQQPNLSDDAAYKMAYEKAYRPYATVARKKRRNPKY